RAAASETGVGFGWANAWSGGSAKAIVVTTTTPRKRFLDIGAPWQRFPHKDTISARRSCGSQYTARRRAATVVLAAPANPSYSRRWRRRRGDFPLMVGCAVARCVC